MSSPTWVVANSACATGCALTTGTARLRPTPDAPADQAGLGDYAGRTVPRSTSATARCVGFVMTTVARGTSSSMCFFDALALDFRRRRGPADRPRRV